MLRLATAVNMKVNSTDWSVSEGLGQVLIAEVTVLVNQKLEWSQNSGGKIGSHLVSRGSGHYLL